MSTGRRLQDLNPADRPDRAPPVAPPARRVTPPRPPEAVDRENPHPRPPGTSGSVHIAREKATKVMHSVPVDVLDQLKQAAACSGRSYTDIVVGCVVDHREHLAASGGRHESPLRALDRRRQQIDHPRCRSAQLTLYLTAAERGELDRLATELGMARSQLVTAALQRGLNDLL